MDSLSQWRSRTIRFPRLTHWVMGLIAKASTRERASTKYEDAEPGDPVSEPPTPTAAPPRPKSNTTPRRINKAPDEETKRTLISSLRAVVTSIEKHMVFADGDLEDQLEGANYQVDWAASEFIERAGLRQIEANTTLTQIDPVDDNPSVKNAWSVCEPTVFRVRCGPNYRQTKLKAQCKAPMLYHAIGIDVYSSDQKVEHLSRFMKLGNLETAGADSPLPELFIINFMLPLDEPKLPSLFGPQTVPDGRTVSWNYVFRINQWTKDNFNHPSVQLFCRFLNHCADGGSMRERLKIIFQVANPDEMNLNRVERGIYKKYNGLPFLYRQYNSTFRRGAGWFQADFDGHRSGYTTRFSRYALLGFSDRIVANVAFLIEAETDDEMPEKLIGACSLYRIESQNAKPFVKPVTTPLSPRLIQKRVFDDVAPMESV